MLRCFLGSTTFRHSKLRYSNHLPASRSPLNVRGQSVKAASLSRIEALPRLAAGAECGHGGGGALGGGSAGGGGRPGYGYEALSAASDGSDGEPDDVPEYAAFEMELSGGGESVDGPSSRASNKVNFPPEVELERRPTAAAVASAVYHRGRGRSMSAWSDISRTEKLPKKTNMTNHFHFHNKYS
ncbi:Uncharacterized protein OBRU01_20131 [Operophtera brumata]|uniref:Uncharacterized protein n=1 Tax=Operophtera brumata TaxID=104452 RepID=A0A0L7KVS0_OPEBR|nr:Uncharacterized protein OBRU01_20131 [Operophtera brumata]